MNSGSGSALLALMIELILQLVDECQFVRVLGIEHLDTDADAQVLGVLGQLMCSDLVDHEGAIVVVIRKVNRCVATFRECRDGDRSAFGRIDNAHGVERVPVHPDDVLLVQGGGTAEMKQAIHAARHLDDVAKLPVAFGADVGFSCDQCVCHRYLRFVVRHVLVVNCNFAAHLAPLPKVCSWPNLPRDRRLTTLSRPWRFQSRMAGAPLKWPGAELVEKRAVWWKRPLSDSCRRSWRAAVERPHFKTAAALNTRSCVGPRRLAAVGRESCRPRRVKSRAS